MTDTPTQTTDDTTADALETARRRYAELKEQLQAIEAEIQGIGIARWRATQEAELDAAAEALVAGAADGKVVAFDDRRLEDLQGRRRVLERAVAMMGGRFHELRQAQYRKITKGLRPEHRLAAARVAAAVVELSAANAAEAAIRAKAPGGGLPSCAFPGIGTLTHPDSNVRQFLKYLKRLGYDPDALAPAAAAE